jgi:tetratricopeptide (TPR) repeat protein
MPIVVAQQAKRVYINTVFDTRAYRTQFLVKTSEIGDKYNHMIKENTRANVYISRIFNENFQVSAEPRLFSSLNLWFAQVRDGNDYIDDLYFDFEALANKLCIPDGYYIEILVTSIVNREFGEKVVFPNETKLDVIKALEDIVKERLEVLNKIATVSQSHSFLSELGLSEISKELSLGYSRFEIGDYDGAIKAYRKVVEGFRNYLVKKEDSDGKKVYKKLIDNSESRTEKIIEYLSKTYSLLSNFGEHYGTHAYDEEGVFAHKIVENLTEYLTKKLRS